MDASDLALLKASGDRVLELRTTAGEVLRVRVIWVFDTEDLPDLFYFDAAAGPGEPSGFAIPLAEIGSVRDLGQAAATGPSTSDTRRIYAGRGGGNEVGRISADGLRIVRSTCADSHGYLNFVNRATGGNLRVQWHPQAGRPQ